MKRKGRASRIGATDFALAESSMAPKVAWEELSETEQTALKRMNRGPHTGLAGDVAERLVSLGLAVQRPEGIGISRAGRSLVIDRLLDGRQKERAAD